MIRRPLRTAVAVLAPLALVLAACGDDDDDAVGSGATTTEAAGGATTTAGNTGTGGETCADFSAPDDAPEITIGAQDFGESAVVAQLYSQCLQAAGYDVSVQEVGGFRDLEVAAFDNGDINLAPEYAASMLEFLNDNAGEATGDAQATTDLLNQRLADKDLTALTPSAAVDTNAFVVTQETSDSLGLTTLSDLADHQDLTLGAPADCETNPFCLPGLERVYGVDLSEGFTALETGAIPDSLDSGAIDIGLLFSTDSRIATNDWVLLEDDQGMLAADNIVPVLTTELAGVDGLSDLLNLVSSVLTTDNVTEMNRLFDVETQDADDIATSFLGDNGLL